VAIGPESLEDRIASHTHGEGRPSKPKKPENTSEPKEASPVDLAQTVDIQATPRPAAIPLTVARSAAVMVSHSLVQEASTTALESTKLETAEAPPIAPQTPAAKLPDVPMRPPASVEHRKWNEVSPGAAELAAVQPVAVPAPAPSAVSGVSMNENLTGAPGATTTPGVPHGPLALIMRGKGSGSSRDVVELPAAQPLAVDATPPPSPSPARSGWVKGNSNGGAAASFFRSAAKSHLGSELRRREEPSDLATAPCDRGTSDVAGTRPSGPVADDSSSGAPRGDAIPSLSVDLPRESAPSPLAFAARLTPAGEAEVPIPSSAPAPALIVPDAPVTAPKATEEDAGVRPLSRVRRPEPAAEPGQDLSPESQDTLVDAPARAAAAASPIPQRHEPRLESASAEQAASRPAEPVQAPAERQSVVESMARDIRFELAGAGRRVEVRLEERAGEVRVSVRTPDGALADTLRDHLPGLSARLEQSGLRADQWRAADAFGGTRPLEMPGLAGGTASEGRQHQSGSRGDPAPREQSGRQREPRGEGQSNRNQKGKSFAWLISSLE